MPSLVGLSRQTPGGGRCRGQRAEEGPWRVSPLVGLELAREPISWSGSHRPPDYQLEVARQRRTDDRAPRLRAAERVRSNELTRINRSAPTGAVQQSCAYTVFWKRGAVKGAGGLYWPYGLFLTAAGNRTTASSLRLSCIGSASRVPRKSTLGRLAPRTRRVHVGDAMASSRVWRLSSRRRRSPRLRR